MENVMWSPDVIVGYRVWSVRHDRIEGIRAAWRRPEFEAQCTNRRPLRPAPHFGDRCACGVYAAKDPQWLAKRMVHSGRAPIAMGQVALSGRVVEHTNGYRAQRAAVTDIAVRMRAGIYRFDDPDRIAALFAAPAATLRQSGPDEVTSFDTLAAVYTKAASGETRGTIDGYW